MRTPEPDHSPTPVFGLTKGQLQAVVAKIAGEPVVEFNISIEHEVRQDLCGGRGEKVLPTFGYRTRSGRVGRATVFAKRHCNVGPNEALHYRWLARHFAPIPRMYGAISGPELRDIVFLEHIDPFLGDEELFLRSERSMPAFLSVTARFNAIRPSRAYAAKLPCKLRWMGLEDLVPVLRRFWGHGAQGKLGDDLRRWCSRAKLDSLTALAARLPGSIAEMRQSLSHWDHRPHNIGWRRETREMLIFDLEDTMIGPRFDDVADWLGAPDEVQPRCRPRDELARYYLSELERWRGRLASVREFLDETRLLWMAHVLRGLDWWLGYRGVLEGCETPAGGDAVEYRRRNRDRLQRELSGVLASGRS